MIKIAAGRDRRWAFNAHIFLLPFFLASVEPPLHGELSNRGYRRGENRPFSLYRF